MEACPESIDVLKIEKDIWALNSETD